jgi:hypothetical protein
MVSFGHGAGVVRAKHGHRGGAEDTRGTPA